ncbi:MAG: glycoside hydrolase family 3 C-terminal domain-containing protein [Lachnospiraceae bacterium]|nr:glycoside hydrolase family 3 C-terminal domain-containing protein [Lachnospiraceae bacterium]
MEFSENTALLTEYRRRAAELVGKMTLDEKVSQLVNHSPAIERLGIPAYDWWNEALHGIGRAGVATVFPQAIGLAATFDEDLMEKIADTISTEGRAKYNMQSRFEDRDIYKGLTFWSPNINIFRDPRWGRGQETLGEDPYLTSRLGVRFVMGLQGHDARYMKLAACAKHFAVHSGPEGIRHSFDAKADPQDMRETYLPAFKALVQEAKVEAVMGAYNRTNGEPCCGSKTLLKDILRDEWGFEGHVVSDCWAIKDFHTGHMVTANEIESISLAMNNGCDINCGDLFVLMKKAIEEGRVSEERLDEALTNLYTTRMKLGVFDGKGENPYDALDYTVVDTVENQHFNREVAEKCMVLLKNNGLLPLDKSKIRSIGIVGPNTNSRKALVGNYEGTASRYFTISEGIQEYVGEDIRVFTSEGCHMFKQGISGLSQGHDRLSEVKGVCEVSDVVVVCLGLDADLEGEEGDAGNEFGSGDKPNLKLPGEQEEVLKIAVASGKPVILALLSGSALAVPYADEHADAIMQCWYPGAQGGRAFARLLFGDVNPEGKLPITFYRTSEELPEFTDYSMKGRTYRYMQNEALYPFGYGLSYTDYRITDVKASSDTLGEEGIKVCAKVKNNGKMDGVDTIQVYVKIDEEGTPNPQLKGIAKVALKAGEEKEVLVSLKKEAFGLFDEQGKFQYATGKAIVYVGDQQPDTRSEKLTGKKVAALTINL